MRTVIFKIGLIIFFIMCGTIILFEIILIVRDIPKKYPLELIDESDIRIQIDDSIILETLKPNSSTMLAGAYVKINSLGFRDYEYDIKKPKDKFRIAVLGDSFTFGYGVELGDSYPKQLEKLLTHSKYEVLNFGGNGGNTLLEAEYLNSTVLNFQPDLIIVGFFPNDADIEYISDKEFCNKLTAKKSKDEILGVNYELDLIRNKSNTLFSRISYDGVDRYFMNLYSDNEPGYLCFKEGIQRFSEIARQNNLNIFFIIIPVKRDGNKRQQLYRLISDKVELIIKHNSLTVYNLEDRFELYKSKEVYTKIGPPHFNKLGNKLIAEGLYEILVQQGYVN